MTHSNDVIFCHESYFSTYVVIGKGGVYTLKLPAECWIIGCLGLYEAKGLWYNSSKRKESRLMQGNQTPAEELMGFKNPQYDQAAKNILSEKHLAPGPVRNRMLSMLQVIFQETNKSAEEKNPQEEIRY